MCGVPASMHGAVCTYKVFPLVGMIPDTGGK